MNFITALWQAIIAFFSHFKKQKAEEKARIQSERERHDEEIRSASNDDLNKRLDKWMRD